MNGIPFEIILLTPLGFTLFLSVWILFVFLMIIFMTTPAWTFFWAKLRKRIMVINPGEDKILRFKPAKKYGSMAYVKKQGFYLIDPHDIYLEAGSKIPTTITFGRFAIPINIKMAKVADRLKELGIKNWQHLMTWFASINKAYKEEFDKNPEAEPEEINVNILGESVPLDVSVNYFNRNERADFIESEIQRRTAYEASRKVGQGANMLKWIIIIGVFIMMVFVGYAIFETAIGAERSIPLSQLPDLLGTQRVISETTGTGLK